MGGGQSDGMGGGPSGGGKGGGMRSPLATVSGIAKNGGIIYNGLDGKERDAVQNEWEGLDECLMHPSPHG